MGFRRRSAAIGRCDRIVRYSTGTLRACGVARILLCMGTTDSLANHLLIAMPSLSDGNFAQTVALVCEHSERGALGIVLNKPMGMKLGDVMAQMKLEPSDIGIGEQPVLRGGPVHAPTAASYCTGRVVPGTSTHRISDNVQVTIVTATCHGGDCARPGPARRLRSARLRRLGRRTARARNARITPGCACRSTSALCSNYRSKIAGRQPGSCWAWTARGSVSPLDMPEARARVVLAFDFGLRRIGVASGDTISNAAAPCGAVQVTDRGIDWSAIKHLLHQYSARPAGGRQSASRRRFPQPHRCARRSVRRRLGGALRSPGRARRRICLLDRGRRRTQQLQRASGQRRRRLQRHADIDSAAAAIILERWLRGEGRIDD